MKSVSYTHLDVYKRQSSGNLKLVKTSEDGNVANIEFTVKGENFNKTVKTNSKCEFELTDLVPGTYTVTENTEGKYAKQNNEKEHQHAIGVEPHIWNSAVNAQIIAGNILSALRNIDKGNEDFYLDPMKLRQPSRRERCQIQRM